MNPVRLHLSASALSVAGLALIIAGLDGAAALWQAGLAVTGVAMLLSLATRWTREPDRKQEKQDAPREKA